MTRQPAIAILCEERFHEVGGEIYGSNAFGRSYWQRYGDVFGNLVVIARVETRDRVAQAAEPLAGAVLDLRPLPSFRGPARLLPKLPGVLGALRRTTRGVDGFIVRWPGTLTLLALPYLLASGKPIAVEVVGDSRAVFRSGVGGLASAVLARLAAAAGKHLFAAASAVTYVTERHLQAHYPAPPGAIEAAFSDVVLADGDLAARPRPAADFESEPARLLFAGTMEQGYKGINVLLDAAARLDADGADFELRIAGAGRLEAAVRARIAALALERRVAMLGRISRPALRAEMDRCHLFLVPSLTEGLPRTIVEAMARAAPVLASDVGGIPELLPPHCLVPPGDAAALAAAIADRLARPAALAAMSNANLAGAARFTEAATAPARRSFYLAFRALAEAEAAQGGGGAGRNPKKSRLAGGEAAEVQGGAP
ncbi:MAG TPA: glycosyltransferase [Allosphingosinicella sp.]|jgi:glycosyltransferase involved in cell wall biosynthesis